MHYLGQQCAEST